eukprot:gene5971-11332_t
MSRLILYLLLTVCLTSEAEVELLEHLFNGYNSDARPVLKDSDAVNVTLGITISQIVDVDEKNQIFTVSVWMRQKWKNPLLAWDPSRFNNISSINVRPKKLWLPDIVLYNNADSDITFGGNFDRLNTRVILSHNGNSVWLAPVIIKSKCQIDVKYFPFDEQSCSLKFGSWTYDGFRLNLAKEAEKADLSKFLKNAEWHLVDVPAVRNEVKYFCCPEHYPDVTYTFIMKRRSLFYLTNLIFPMVLMCALTILSFLLPAESGERISLAITLLLAMTVFMLVVAEMIPPTSEVIPLVGIFFNAAMVEMVLMIVSLCVVIRFYHKQSTDPPMPQWMRKYVLDNLSYKLKVRSKKTARNSDESVRPHVELVYLSNNKSNGRLDLRVDNNAAVIQQSGPKRAISNGMANRRKEKGYLMDGAGSTASARNEGMFETGIIAKKLDIIIEKLSQKERDEKYRQEWRIVAMTFDKCLLIVFCCISIFTILVIFLNSPGYVV